MIPLLMLAGCALVISVFQSTRPEREAARQRLARHNAWFIAVALILWGALLWDLIPWPWT